MNTDSTVSRTIAIITSAFGGLVVLAVAGFAALGAAFDSGALGMRQGVSIDESGNRVQTADVSGIDSLDVESSASDFTLRFADVPEARLEVSGESNRAWSLGVEEGELSVKSERPFPGFCLGWCGDQAERVTLTLPARLGHGVLDAELEVSAGSLSAEGSFRDLDLTLSAGALYFDGTAGSLSADVSAGRGEITVADAQEADFEVSAGRLEAVLTGSAPKRTEVEVSAGHLDLTVPGGLYDVRSDVSAGSLENRLETSSRADRSIVVSVSAGAAVLRPGA